MADPPRLSVAIGQALSWQQDFEAASLPRTTGNQDLASALRDDAMHCGQTESGAFAFDLRREERLEDSGFRRFVHAAAGVRHLQHDVLAGIHSGEHSKTSLGE